MNNIEHMNTSPHIEQPRPTPLMWGATLTLAAWIVYRAIVLLRAAWPFNTDDAYITMRYARHLAEGHGLTWNVGGALVEGYSNFLFVLIGAAAIRLGVDPIVCVKVMSVGAMAITCITLYALARRWCSPLVATLPALLLVSDRGQLLWSASGLETAVYQCWVVTSAWAVCAMLDAAEAGRSRRALGLGALAGCLLLCASLTRAEGPVLLVLLAALFIGKCLWLTRAQRADDASWLMTMREVARPYLGPVVALFALGGGLYTLYFVWRANHFGHLVPNTVLCKASYTRDPWHLIRDAWGSFHLMFLLAWLYPLTRTSFARVYMLAVPLLYALILYGADPIIGHDNRHFLAAYALLLPAMAASLDALLPHVFPSRWRPHATAALVLALCLWLYKGQDDLRASIARHADHYARRMHAREAMGRWLNAQMKPQERLVLGDAGIAPYVLRAQVIDAFCLNNPHTTAPPISKDPARFTQWVYAQKPEYIAIHSSSPRRLRPRREYEIFPRLAAHPDLKARYRKLKVFGARGDAFHYWVYRRQPDAP